MKSISQLIKVLLGGSVVFLLVFAVVNEVRAQTCVAPPAGLVSWWPGDGNANDIADANDGTLQGGAGFAAGEVGQAFSFDGIDDYVSIANTSTMDFGTGDFTLETWINLNSLATVQELIHKVSGSGARASDPSYFLEFDPPNALRFRIQSSLENNNDLIIPTALTTGRWYHVAGVRSGNTNLLYLDGVLIGSQTVTSNINTGTGGASTLGRCTHGEFDCTRFLNGFMDEPALYNRALSAAEIAAIFNAGSAGKCKVTSVDIDIKPGDDPNSVRPDSPSLIPVAILGTTDFDATTVDPLTVEFGPGGAMKVHEDGHVEDVNGDGYLDLLLHFNTQDTGIQCGAEEATLTGETFDGQAIEGSDSINTVGCQ